MDIVTNQRIIETTVIVDNEQILVLGGLIEDQIRESEQRVPVLGKLPLLGNLFRARRTTAVKTNLLVFIRPKILRDAASIATETHAKYRTMQDLLEGQRDRGVRLMPDIERSTLPPIESLTSPAEAATTEPPP